MKVKAICVLIALSFLTYVQSQKQAEVDYTDTIQIYSGPIKGIFRRNVLSKKKYAAFLGIPYAEPPLREKRFLPPFEIKPWKRVLLAVQDGHSCPQYNDNQVVGKEDCLFLNVYTPVLNLSKPQKQLKAVMVWIHGGAFLTGSGNSSKFGPDFLIDKDVILVTFNYRLGALGFLNLKHSLIPGNAGLKDQHLVLQWVQKNIFQFGGDPNNVTLFGQSAGAVSVDLHSIAKQSKDLFARSIAISGSVFCPWGFMTSSASKKHGLNLAEKINTLRIPLNNTDEVVKLFRNAPFEMLVEHTGLLSNIKELRLPFVPSIEVAKYEDREPFIKECFVDNFIRGEIHKGDHILGFTSLETGVALTYFEKSVGRSLHNVASKISRLWHYITNRRKRTLNLFRSSFEESSELMFSTGIDMKQRFLIHYNKIKSVYYYYFNYTSSDSILNGVVHTEDLKYIFYNKGENPRKIPSRKGSFDELTRDRVVTLYTNFAKNGIPTYANFNWLKSDKDGGYLDISKKLVMKTGLRPITNNVYRWVDQYIIEYNNKTCVPNVYDILEHHI